jgi:uncharacterized protein (TIGR00369 family)
VQPRDPGFERVVRDSFARQGIMAHLGARLADVAAGAVAIEVPFRAELSQQHGYFHAGVVATVMDSAAGYAGLSLMPAGSAVLSVEFKVNLLAPADGDLLRARGKVVRAGRTLTVCSFDAEVRKQGTWTPCATGIQTLMCLPAKAEGRVAG